MADLEQHAIKRDKRFIVRLVLALLVGALGGGFIYAKMTSPRTGACAAHFFGGRESPTQAPGTGDGTAR